MSATKMSPFQIPPACNACPRNLPGKTFEPNWCSRDKSWAETGWCSTIAPNGITGPLTGAPEPPLMRCLLIRQEILNVSQIAGTFHGIRPPFFIQTWLQQYSRSPFLNFAHCSLSNRICFRSVRCWPTMIPGKVFTGLAKFYGIVSVNDFWFPRQLHWTFVTYFSFPEKFLFCMGMIVSTVLPSLVPLPRIDDCVEIHILHWELFDPLVRILQWSPRNLGSQAGIAISVPSESEWRYYAYPIPLLLAALKVINEKNWKRLGVLEHHHLPDFPRTLPAIPARSRKVSPRTSSLSFLFGFSVSVGPTRRVSSYFITHILTSCWSGMLFGTYGFLRWRCRRCRWRWARRACR